MLQKPGMKDTMVGLDIIMVVQVIIILMDPIIKSIIIVADGYLATGLMDIGILLVGSAGKQHNQPSTLRCDILLKMCRSGHNRLVSQQ
jgi:hypothetical protein